MSVRSRQVTAAAGAGIVAVALLPAVSAGAATPTYRHSEHVLVLSVDGMHSPTWRATSVRTRDQRWPG